MANQLTTRAIEALKPGPARREVPDGMVGGLYLIVQPSGAKSWAFRFRRTGKGVKLTLGAFPAISLQAARLLAGEAAVALARGLDPAAARRASKCAAEPVRDDFATVVSEYVLKYAVSHTRPRSARETERLLTGATAAWRGRRLSDIRRADLARLLDGIIARGAPVVANRTLAALSRLGVWAVERGLIDASPFAAIRAPSPETPRSRILSIAEIIAAWTAFGAAGVAGQVAQVLTLTGSRLREAAAMEWSEVDLDAHTWTLQAARSKNRTAHEVPLSPPVLAILAARKADSPTCKFVFSVNGRTAIASLSRAKRGFDAAMAAELRAPPAPWVLHDLRRTCASGMAGLGVQPHVIEAALNHRSGAIAGVARVYNRHPYAAEKRAALDAWAAELVRITAPANAELMARAA